MVTGSDISVAQDGGQGHVKLHPYLVALVRWCVSCVWSTATILLHRLVAGSMPVLTIRAAGITGISPPKAARARAPGTEHLHPEPRVHCEVLHSPPRAQHDTDVIFVHGLYGSLANTWRQGDWRSKYKLQPNKVPLLRPTDCKCENETSTNKLKLNDYETDINEAAYRDMEEKLYRGIKKILPNEEAFIAEKFYNNTLLDQVEVVDNYDTQAKFVRDLFERDNSVDCNEQRPNQFGNQAEFSFDCAQDGCKTNEVACKCKRNEASEGFNGANVVADCECRVSSKQCEVGCGCVCDVCYSPCWPRDWIKEDYPNARVISINYTSDPYLWRPLWIKECKRLRLHERAEQMTQQLLALGVGEKPIIWVGHSKGGLFIKQIYCEAYEAYNKTQNVHRINDGIGNSTQIRHEPNDAVNNNECANETDMQRERDNVELDKLVLNETETFANEKCSSINNEINGNVESGNAVEFNGALRDCEAATDMNDNLGFINASSSYEKEDYTLRQAQLWTNSVGFMFYSVPHRGSPLADIKTPITARSIELLEISKDCGLVLSLQERWLAATSISKPQVRSLVETCRTLMSVLWLRIVSVPSADAGIGALYGVSVDHREICKPSSRRCLLYRELMGLINAALRQCRCDT